jgi:hypothetical protein
MTSSPSKEATSHFRKCVHQSEAAKEGLALIHKAVQQGHFIRLNDCVLQSVYEEPGFAPFLELQQARQKRERERFLTIVCHDNPYEAVWQPEEGTCEEFLAESTE